MLHKSGVEVFKSENFNDLKSLIQQKENLELKLKFSIENPAFHSLSILKTALNSWMN